MGKIVWVIERNSDFTEGRGPMQLHSIMDEYDTAHDYVMKQDGVFGSKQRYDGVSKYGKQKVHRYNGYNIKPIEVLTKEDVNSEAKLREYIASNPNSLGALLASAVLEGNLKASDFNLEEAAKIKKIVNDNIR